MISQGTSDAAAIGGQAQDPALADKILGRFRIGQGDRIARRVPGKCACLIEYLATLAHIAGLLVVAAILPEHYRGFYALAIGARQQAAIGPAQSRAWRALWSLLMAEVDVGRLVHPARTAVARANISFFFMSIMLSGHRQPGCPHAGVDAGHDPIAAFAGEGKCVVHMRVQLILQAVLQ